MKFYSFYRSPNQHLFHPHAEKNTLDFIAKNKTKSSFLCGDINIPYTDWCTNLPSKKLHKKFVQDILASDFNQINLTSTREDNILDVIITDIREKVVEIDVDQSEDSSDHKPITMKLKLDRKKEEFVWKPNPNKTDWKAVNDELKSIDFEKLQKHNITHFYRQTDNGSTYCNFNTTRRCVKCNKIYCKNYGYCKCGTKGCNPELEINERADNLAKIIKQCITKHTPIEKKYVLPHNKGFISPRTLKQRNRVKNLRKKRMFKELEEAKETLKLYRKADADREFVYLQKHLDNKKNLYKSMSEVRQGQKSVKGIYVNYPDSTEITYDQKLKTNILNDFYQKSLQISDPFDNDWSNYESKSGEPVINKETIRESIKRMNGSNTPGPEGFSPNQLKRIAESILDPLEILYIKCYEFSILPRLFKVCKIIPIPKKGNLLIPKNNRPINIESTLYKPLERILCNFTYQHLESIKFFSDSQHGFRAFKSCTTQLTLWTDTLQHNGLIFPSYTTMNFDFSKAFDSVDFSITIREIKKTKIDIHIAKLFQNWLTDRYQYTVIGENCSKSVPVTSSIIQGSTFGAKIGFNLVINTLFEKINKHLKEIPGSIILAYADDVKWIVPNNLPTYKQNLERCQMLCDEISKWAESEKLLLNGPKSFFQIYGTQPPKKCNPQLFVTIKGEKIPMSFSSSERDLGVIYTSDRGIDFKNHVNSITDRCKIVIKNSKSTINKLSFQQMVHVFQLYIRSIATYAGIVWFTPDVQTMNKLNEIYRDFWSLSKHKTTYDNIPLTLFQELILETLQFHRRQEKLKVKDRSLPPNPMDPLNDKSNMLPPKIDITKPRLPKRKYEKFTITPKKALPRSNKLQINPPSPPKRKYEQRSSNFKQFHRKVYYGYDLTTKCSSTLRHRFKDLFDEFPNDVKKMNKENFKTYITLHVFPKITPECESLRKELWNGELHLKRRRKLFYQKYYASLRDGNNIFDTSDLQMITGSNETDQEKLFQILKSDENLVNRILQTNIKKKN